MFARLASILRTGACGDRLDGVTSTWLLDAFLFIRQGTAPVSLHLNVRICGRSTRASVAHPANSGFPCSSPASPWRIRDKELNMTGTDMILKEQACKACRFDGKQRAILTPD